MAGYSPVKPPQSPHDNNDDLSSLYSRPSIQNSPDWPSVKLHSPGPSVRTLNQSDGGTCRDDDMSSLANFSSKGLDPSVRSSVFTANMSTSPSSSRRHPSAPSGSSHEQYQHLSLEESEDSGRRSGGSTQPSPSIRAYKRPYQHGLPPLVLSSRKSTIGSTVFQDDSSYRSASLLIDNVNEDLPRQSVSTDIVLVPPLQSTPNGNVKGRSIYSSEGQQRVSTDATAMLCHSCSFLIEGAFVRALGTTFHVQCFRCIDCGAVATSASEFFSIADHNEKQQPLCERDYFQRIDLVCANCGEALRGSYITACDKKYHVEHFTCTLCLTLFDPQDSYYEHNKDVYCHYHYSTRFAHKCAGCKTAILTRFVKIKRNRCDECWHPECFMIDKSWNVKVVPRSPEGLTDTTEAPYVEEERQESHASLKEKQIKMERQVHRICTVLSAYEDSIAATVAELLRHTSNGSYIEAIRTAERTVLHVEVLFAAIDDIEWNCAWLDIKGTSHLRESRIFYKKLVGLFALLSGDRDTDAQRRAMAQRLLELVTGITDCLKVLIRIALMGALRLERNHGSSGALESFLDKLHMITVRKGSPSSRRMIAGAKDVVPLSERSASINSTTYGVAYGFRSLAPEVAGASPFLDASQDLAISNVPVPSDPSDACVACGLTFEEGCVRLGTYQRWHSNCIRCQICGTHPTPATTANTEDKALVRPGRGVGDGIMESAVSTTWRTPANFFWSPDSITDTHSFGEVPTAIYCTDDASPGCRGGFQAVSRLEQYTFLLNVALRRLHLLTKRNVTMSMPTNLNSQSSGETNSNPSPQKVVYSSTSVHPDRKLPAMPHTMKSSTIVGSPSTLLHSAHTKFLTPIANGPTATTAITTSYQSLSSLLSLPALPPSSLPLVDEATHSSDATVSTGNPLPEPTPSDILRPGEAENGVEQRRSLPRYPMDVPKLSKLARLRVASKSEDNTSKNLLPEATPAGFLRPRETGKAAKQHHPLPLIPTDEMIILAETQLLGAAPLMEWGHLTPLPNLTPYVAELTTLELEIVRHAAVAVLYRSSLRDEVDLDQILEMLEVKRLRFSEKPENDRKKEGLFGVRLDLLVERDGVDSLLGASRAIVRVPCFIVDVISALRQMDMKFHSRSKRATTRHRKALITALDRDPSSVDFTREHTAELVRLLACFLRELPDPLLTLKLQELFISATCLPNDEERKRLLHMLMLILPKCHRDTLEVLLVFLKRDSSFVTVRGNIGTDSSFSNRASVLGPSVLFSDNWVHMSRSTDGGISENYGVGARAMAELLENQNQFFTVPEEFLPLLHDQDFFASSMELTSKDFLKQCETYTRTMSVGPRGKMAERLRR